MWRRVIPIIHHFMGNQWQHVRHKFKDYLIEDYYWLSLRFTVPAGALGSAYCSIRNSNDKVAATVSSLGGATIGVVWPIFIILGVVCLPGFIVAQIFYEPPPPPRIR